MFSPRGNYFMIVGLINKWAKGGFLGRCYDDGSLLLLFLL